MAYHNQHQPYTSQTNYNHAPTGNLAGQQVNDPFQPPQRGTPPSNQNEFRESRHGDDRQQVLNPQLNGEHAQGHVFPGQKAAQHPHQNLPPREHFGNPHDNFKIMSQPPMPGPPSVSAVQRSMGGGMPLHGSNQTRIDSGDHSSSVRGVLQASSLAGQPPLQKSFTPPPSSSPARHSPASNMQGQNALSSRSTPPSMIQPSATRTQGAFKPVSFVGGAGMPPPPLLGQQQTLRGSSTPSTGLGYGPPLPGQVASASPTPVQNSAITNPLFQGEQFKPPSSQFCTQPDPAMQQYPPPNSLQSPHQHPTSVQPPPFPEQVYPPSSGPASAMGQQMTAVPPPLSRPTYVPQPRPQLSQPSGAGLPLPPMPGQPYTPSSSVQGITHSGVGVAPPPLPGQPYQPQAVVRPPPMSNVASSMNATPPSSSAVPQSAAYAPVLNQPSSVANRQPTPGPYPGAMSNITNSMANMDMSEANRPINLMQETRALPFRKPVEQPLRFETNTNQGTLIPPDRKNCNPDVLRCTLKTMPHSQSLLNKVKLPLGLVIHPFKDLSSLPVISAGTIVRCKRCRTYINPFVSFLDERRWRCNMCFAVNEAPEEFLHHPVNKTYGQPHTRPECTNSTIEFIAPQEYMLRPPQPAVYLFLMDVSHSAIESGYLQIVCDSLLDHLDSLPGDARTQIGFLTYNGTVHFYRLSEGLPQPQMIIVSDIDDVFLPTPENLLVNLRESRDLVEDLLQQLPLIHNLNYEGEGDTYSSLGAALEVAKKLMTATGGRVTVFQQSIPNAGPGSVKPREDPNKRAGETPTALLNPATDFYKKMALDCSAHQIAVDFFFFNSLYIDIATLSCSSRFSAGDLHYYPSLHVKHNPMEAERLSHDLQRYLTRKIGFESVMRIRCTKGIGVHTFHGNFFVRSTDLLSLANVNPDSGYAVNLTIEDPLQDMSSACFQAALLYTTSKGERRIRVHTMCLPVVKSPAEVLNSVDCIAVVALLSKMGVDRSVTASVADARDALLNAVIDPLKAYKDTLPQGMTTGGVYVPRCLRLMPLYMQCVLKHPAFRMGVSTKLDDRVFSMVNLKMQPASYLLQGVHPDLYRVDDLHDEGAITVFEKEVPQPNILPLSAESILQTGAFLLDCGWRMYLLVGRQTSRSFINNVLGAPQFSNIEEPMYSIPELKNPQSEMFHTFVDWLQGSRPHYAPIRVIRDDMREKILFFSHLFQDRTESAMSYQEFIMHVQKQLN
ncbi:protein transport protein Sec24A-like isoform X2 [Clavelina lepadiformis]|uniref:Protein transport protein Sec24A n=1 Tax=Clavelina lepadiformis TaxID=159417 RepID=A0ABP0G458_CLALP